MTLHQLGFSAQQLHQGAIMGTIAHAIWIADDPLVGALQAWDGPHYLLNDISGTIATITFDAAGVIAVFFDASSPRNPLASNGQPGTERYLAGMPEALTRVAHADTLRYMLQDVQGQDTPVITAALWSEDGVLVATEPWAGLRENGGHIIDTQLKEDGAALVAWQNNYSLSAEQTALLRSLYARKIAAGDARIQLADAEKGLLAGTGAKEAQELLASIGIDA